MLFTRLEGFHGSSFKKDIVDLGGQNNIYVLSPEGGGPGVEGSVQGSKTDLCTSNLSGSHLESGTSGGLGQQKDRLSKQTDFRVKRVGVSQGSNRIPVHSVGDTNEGSVCHKGQYQMQNVLFLEGERQERECLLYAIPLSPYREGVVEGVRMQSAIYSDRLSMGETHLFPNLINLSLEGHIKLPRREDLFSQRKGEILHPRPDSINVWAWHLKG